MPTQNGEPSTCHLPLFYNSLISELFRSNLSPIRFQTVPISGLDFSLSFVNTPTYL
jgi:hypothetical protein